MTPNIYKFSVKDRNYTNFSFSTLIDYKEKELKDFSPQTHHLFNDDIFTYDESSGAFELKNSSVRSMGDIAGVLILKGSKTYGRNKNGKLMYKCMPDDNRLPSFLIPYEMKNIGFSKVFQNIYVTFRFLSWDSKHPIGVISQNIGSVDDNVCFYEYQLYCKGLNISINRFTKETSSSLKKCGDNIIEKIESMGFEDRTSWNVFSIDPEGSQDFDDAFSVMVDSDKTMISVYISNVTVWLDVLALWGAFSRRVSTIYLPDKKRTILPTFLSDCLCSLQAGMPRFALVLDLFVDDNGQITKTKFSNCKIKVQKNYCYEAPSLLKSAHYQQLFDVVRKMDAVNKIVDSHELVAFLMIKMNHLVAKELKKDGNGIFRAARSVVQVPENLSSIFKGRGEYVLLEDLKEGETLAHDFLGLDAYVHITSPIRRLVDLLNMIQFQESKGLLCLSPAARGFYQAWITEIDYINQSMRSIKKVQTDCDLLHLCTTSPDVMNKSYEGIIIDRGLTKDTVYLPEIKMISYLLRQDDLCLYEKSQYRLYMFNDEERFKRKIRLQRVVVDTSSN
jgi:exoribonuclease R